jgi:alpha-N-acetylglucosamine transferase
VKRILLFSLVLAGIVLLTILTSCSRENAVKQMMADPQMSAMIMQQLWETPATKAKLVEMVENDTSSMDQIKESLVKDPAKAAEMVDLMLAQEDLKEMITEKTMELHQSKK